MSDRDDKGRSGASETTRAANESLIAKLPFEDRRDFDDAARGLIAPLPDGGRVKGADGGLVWDLSRFGFLHQHEEAPETVNPSLWRQMRLTVQGGLYEVVPGLYQVRTLDLSNITFAEGPEGIVAFDPLISAETARAALDLYYEHRPRKPIVAVVYSHSHVDHFGGIHGIVEKADVDSGKVKIYAPEGFLEAAIAENVLAEPSLQLHVREPAAGRSAGAGRGGSRGQLVLRADRPDPAHRDRLGDRTAGEDRRPRLRVHDGPGLHGHRLGGRPREQLPGHRLTPLEVGIQQRRGATHQAGHALPQLISGCRYHREVGEDSSLAIDQGGPVLKQRPGRVVGRGALRALSFQHLKRLEGAPHLREHPHLEILPWLLGH
jgi:hypothetical protein